MRVLLLAATLLAASLAGAAGQDLPAPAPDVTFKTLDGNTVRLADLRGKVVMVNFWASWCGPCRKEMPLLDEIYEDYRKAGFVLLGVNLDDNDQAARKFLKKTPVSFPIPHDGDGKVADLFGNQAMPSSYFIDKEGNIAHLHQGYRPGEEDQYRKVIKSLLAR